MCDSKHGFGAACLPDLLTHAHSGIKKLLRSCSILAPNEIFYDN